MITQTRLQTAPATPSSTEVTAKNTPSNNAAYVTLAIILTVGLVLLVTEAFLSASLRPIRPIRPLNVTHVTNPLVATSKGLSAHLTLTILPQKPGSSIQGPSYSPTSLALPANSLVTITIVNRDPGDTSLPATSPYGRVSGVVGNAAMVDGHTYSQLDQSKVAHTFTITQLGINVPIPGDAPQGQSIISVTFSFRTGAAGVYMWQCMDPCGGNPGGWGGPMATMGYMMGTLIVR